MTMKDERLINKSILIPTEVDTIARRLQATDPDMSYSMAIRRILRAGITVVGETLSTELDTPTDADKRAEFVERMR